MAPPALPRAISVFALLTACAGSPTADGDTGDDDGTVDDDGGPGADGDDGGADDTAGDSTVGADDDDSGGDTGGVVMGGPGCGFESAAFCETFDAPSTNKGRAGDLDIAYWSAGRSNPQLPTGNGVALGAAPASVPPCRAGLPAQVFPSDDAIICDADDHVASNYLLVAVGSQNYGQNSYRIRQPFDFADRTGTIVFDAEGFVLNGLLGWVSVEITEDPTPIPSFSIGADGQNNDEGASIPRNAVEVQFQNNCIIKDAPGFGVRFIDVLDDYQDTLYTPETQPCVPTQEGKIDHFEIKVSQTRIEVYASPFAADGVTFEPVQLMYAADISLPFSRGYVHLTTHNHATLKYSQNGDFGTTHVYDSWLARWDNVGFDGPVIGNTREYEIPDALVPGENAWNVSGPVMSVAYRVADVADGPHETLHFTGVDLTDVVSAQIAVASWYEVSSGILGDYMLNYRLNGHDWHDRPFTPSEIAVLTNGHTQGAISQMLDVPVEDLVDGDNSIEFVTTNVGQGYPPAVSAIDLILTTE